MRYLRLAWGTIVCTQDKDKWLWGNFEPIPYPGDLFVSDLKIEGQLPPEVTGLFARNGPNPVFINSGYHW